MHIFAYNLLSNWSAFSVPNNAILLSTFLPLLCPYYVNEMNAKVRPRNCPSSVCFCYFSLIFSFIRNLCAIWRQFMSFRKTTFGWHDILHEKMHYLRIHWGRIAPKPYNYFLRKYITKKITTNITQSVKSIEVVIIEQLYINIL